MPRLRCSAGCGGSVGRIQFASWTTLMSCYGSGTGYWSWTREDARSNAVCSAMAWRAGGQLAARHRPSGVSTARSPTGWCRSPSRVVAEALFQELLCLGRRVGGPDPACAEPGRRPRPVRGRAEPAAHSIEDCRYLILRQFRHQPEQLLPLRAHETQPTAGTSRQSLPIHVRYPGPAWPPPAGGQA